MQGKKKADYSEYMLGTAKLIKTILCQEASGRKIRKDIYFKDEGSGL